MKEVENAEKLTKNNLELKKSQDKDRKPDEVMSKPIKIDDKQVALANQNGSRHNGLNAFVSSGTIDKQRPLHLLNISAKTEKALEKMCSKYIKYLEDCENSEIGDICHTASVGRSHYSERLSIIGDSKSEFRSHLSSYIAGKTNKRIIKSFKGETQAKGIVFLFTGQGSQYVGMGRELFETQPDFSKALLECAETIQPHLGSSIIDMLYATGAVPEQVNRTKNAQPLIFAIEYALARLWEAWGLKPSVVIGHSIGEYAAAVITGVMSLNDAAKLVCVRGNVMDSAPGDGVMAAVFCSEAATRKYVEPFLKDVDVAVINAPELVVISGERGSVVQAIEQLKNDKIRAKYLTVSHAFHSPLMDSTLNEFHAACDNIEFHKPAIGFASCMTVNVETDEIARAGYWTDHIRRPVRFYETLKGVYESGYRTFLEIGATNTLCTLAKQIIGDEDVLLLPSLKQKGSAWESVLYSLGSLHILGCDIDWRRFDEPHNFSKVNLPTYLFQKQSGNYRK